MSSVILPHNPKNAGRVSSLRLKEAFESLHKVLGRSIVDLLIYDLERQGIALGNEEYYSLDEVRQVFEATFGEDGASLLMEKLRKALDA
jgi:hypothetical protein